MENVFSYTLIPLLFNLALLPYTHADLQMEGVRGVIQKAGSVCP